MLCAYDGASSPARQIWTTQFVGTAQCGARACWSPLGLKGYAYNNRDKTLAIPLIKLLLKSGPDGRASIVLKGKGDRLGLPALPLTPEVTVQLHNTATDLCWSASFQTAVTENDPGRFRARSD